MTAKLLLAACALASGSAAAVGYVTPTEMTITFTELRLIRPGERRIVVLDGEYVHTFRKGDPGFTAVPLSELAIPAGRYVGVSACMNTERRLRLDGDLYEGADADGYVSGATRVWSVGSDAQASGALARSRPDGGATTMGNFRVGSHTGHGCQDTFFARPVCVTDDPSRCHGGDTILDVRSTPPNVYLLLDLYHAVVIDTSRSALPAWSTPNYPYASLGVPGAAIHLKARSGDGTVGNVTLLFGPDRGLLYAAADSSGLPGLCSGNAYVTVGSAPPGAYVNPDGPTPVQRFDAASGRVLFAAASCGGGCSSGGIVKISPALAAAGTAVSVRCVPDAEPGDGYPPYLGYSYAGGPGAYGGPASMTVQRITDPSGIFSAATGCTGTCGPGGGDSYYP